MRIYSEMECDIGCKDGYPCPYYDKENDKCTYPIVKSS